MKNVILLTLSGLILIVGGVVMFYFYLTTIDSSNNFLLFGLAILMTGIAAFCFIKANKPSAPQSTSLSFGKTGEGGLLTKNNAMLGEYAKTSDARDRLKMLEAAGDSNVT